MSTVAARTKGSSQAPVSRAAPKGSVASRTQESSGFRSDEQAHPASSLSGRASRPGRTSIAPSRVNGSGSDIDAREKSAVAFRSAPSVAPTDSISHVKSRSGQTRQYSVVNTALPSTQYSPADVGYRGDRRSQVSRMSSQDGSTRGGNAIPLTTTNLEVHNTAPKSRRAASPISEQPPATAAASRRDSRRYSAAAEDYDDRQREIEVNEGRHRSSRRSSRVCSAAAEEYQSQPPVTQVDRDYRRSSRRYSRDVEDDASDSVPPRRYSRRYSNASYERTRVPEERGPASSITSRRHSVATANQRSVYDQRTIGPSQAIVPYVSKDESTVTPTQARDNWSDARTGAQTRQPPKTRRTFSEWQSLESQSRPSPKYRRATRDEDSTISSSQLSPKSRSRTVVAGAVGGIAAGAAARSSTRATSVTNDQESLKHEVSDDARSRQQSVYSGRERRRESQANEVEDTRSRRDSVHSRRETTREARKEEEENFESRKESVHSQRETTPKAKTSAAPTSNHQSSTSTSQRPARSDSTVAGPRNVNRQGPPNNSSDASIPNAPQPPTWQTTIHVVTKTMPDGSIVKDTINRFERGRYVTAH